MHFNVILFIFWEKAKGKKLPPKRKYIPSNEDISKLQTYADTVRCFAKLCNFCLNLRLFDS